MVVAEAFRGHPRFVNTNPRQFLQHIARTLSRQPQIKRLFPNVVRIAIYCNFRVWIRLQYFSEIFQLFP